MSDTQDYSGGVSAPGPVVKWGVLGLDPPFALSVQDVPATGSGNAFSIIVPSMKVDLQNEEQPLQATATASFQLPVTVPPDGILAGYMTDIRGYVNLTNGARAVLFVDIAAAPAVFEFPFGQEAAGDFNRDLFSLQRSDSGGELAAHPVSPVLNITLVLTVQRLTPQDRGTLEVDTLDLLALFSGRKGDGANDQSGNGAAKGDE